MRVDLYTHKRDLQDLMLIEYQGKLFSNQCFVDRKTEPVKYFFLKLNNEELAEFLDKYGAPYEYRIKESNTNTLLESHKPSTHLN